MWTVADTVSVAVSRCCSTTGCCKLLDVWCVIVHNVIVHYVTGRCVRQLLVLGHTALCTGCMHPRIGTMAPQQQRFLAGGLKLHISDMLWTNLGHVNSKCLSTLWPINTTHRQQMPITGSIC